MRNILIVAPYSQLPTEIGFSRFYYIAEKLSEKGNKVTLVSSKFRHYDKTMRKIDTVEVNDNFKIVLLYEPGYKKNVDIRRIISHKVLARSLNKFLINYNKVFDVIYVSMPIAELGIVASSYALKIKASFIIDVNDIWPEAMEMLLPFPTLGKILFYPMKRLADKVYSRANAIIGVSQTFVDRALRVNKIATRAEAVYLGLRLSTFDSNRAITSAIQKPQGEYWVTYIGMLGHSYDLKTLIGAISILNGKLNLKNIKMKVLGDGPLKDEFVAYAKSLNVDAEFTGYLKYDRMVQYLTISDVAINSIKKKAAQSIVNKVGDYMAASLPILNGSTNEEFRYLVQYFNIGINYEAEDENSLVESILKIYNNPDLAQEMGRNARKLCEDRFDRDKSYQTIIDVIESM